MDVFNLKSLKDIISGYKSSSTTNTTTEILEDGTILTKTVTTVEEKYSLDNKSTALNNENKKEYTLVTENSRLHSSIKEKIDKNRKKQEIKIMNLPVPEFTLEKESKTEPDVKKMVISEDDVIEEKVEDNNTFSNVIKIRGA